VKSTFDGFPPEALKFLRALKRNNNREWFQRNKHVYDEKVKQPMVELVLALRPEFQRFAPEMSCDPEHAIFRIYRDTRFSVDKTPYKSHIAATFHPRGMQKRNCAGLYFHIAPEGVEIAGGVYMIEAAGLLAIRRHVSERHKRFRSIVQSRSFLRLFGELRGERLTRVPKGFAAADPSADLLRHKQFLAEVTKPAGLAETPALFTTLVQLFSGMMPLIHFLNEALKGGGVAKDPRLLRDLGDSAVYFGDS
jgi:uncharacterized protein (TIGR02453 family)